MREKEKVDSEHAICEVEDMCRESSVNRFGKIPQLWQISKNL